MRPCNGAQLPVLTSSCGAAMHLNVSKDLRPWTRIPFLTKVSCCPSVSAYRPCQFHDPRKQSGTGAAVAQSWYEFIAVKAKLLSIFGRLLEDVKGR